MLHGLSFIPAYWWSNLGCNDRQHRSQEFEVLLYTVRAEHEAEEVVRTDQRLRLGDTLPSWQSQRSGRCLEPKELLQQLDDRRKSARTSEGIVVTPGFTQKPECYYMCAQEVHRTHIVNKYDNRNTNAENKCFINESVYIRVAS